MRWFKGMAITALALGMVSASMQLGNAADYPRRSINLIVPFSAGGGGDLVARNIANTLEKKLGKSVVVSNKDGGGGTIGASFVAHARPDGYTVLLTVIGPTLIQPLYGGTDYTRQDLRPVATLVRVPTMIAVNKKTGIKNFEEFMERAKSKEKPISVSLAAAKGLPHLAVESFLRQTQANIRVMPYKGANPAVAATLGGHVDAFCGHPSEVISHTNNGDLIPIAVFTEERIAEFPNIPTLKEKGIDVTIEVWRGLAVPKDTPDDIVNILEKAVAESVKEPAYMEGIKRIGEPPVYLNAKDSAAMWDEEHIFLEKLIKDLGLYHQNK